MSKRGVKIIAIAAIMMCVIVVVGVLSWLTSCISWIGGIPEGEWAICVQDNQGTVLPHACLTVLSADGEPLTFRAHGSAEEAGELFDNYSTPKSVCADENGVLRLKNSCHFGFGGSYWKLFWIWRIGADPQEISPRSWLLKISAPGYKAATMTVGDLLERKEVTVRLEPL